MSNPRSTIHASTTLSPEPGEIRAARVEAGLTQTEAGDTVHASLRTWQQWEAGDRKMHPGLFELFKIKTGMKQHTAEKTLRGDGGKR
jgi:putative transcriptional regulator